MYFCTRNPLNIKGIAGLVYRAKQTVFNSINKKSIDMKKFWLACTMVVTMGISSCVDNEKDLYQEGPEAESNTSKFSTEQDVQIEIDYSLTKAKVPFFIYDQNPIISKKDNQGQETSTCTLNDKIKPLDAAWTEDDGTISKKITLPSYVTDVYIVSEAFYATRMMKGKVVNGVLKVTESEYKEQSETRALGNNSISEEKGRFEKLNWNKLGDYDSNTGQIKYAYKGGNSKLVFTKKEREAFRQTIYSVLNTLGSCPEEYRKSDDLLIAGDPTNEKAKTDIVLTSLGGWTCWNSSLGYYYYREGQTPKSLNDIKIYTVFPNTQTSWNNYDAGGKLYASPRGVTEGTSVQLKFFGENNELKEGTTFPKDYRIGFVLACNTWNYKFTGFSAHKQTDGYMSCSTIGLSSPGANNIQTHTAMFKDKNGNIAICFEDFKDDENFTDVIFALKATPEIKNVPPVDEDLNTTIEKTGVYAFEDEWPEAGDYDMNDVLVQYTYKKVFNIRNEILNESFSFKTLFNKSTVFNNGLGISFKNAGNVNSIDSIRKENEEKFSLATGTDKFVHESNVILFTDNVKTNKNAEYKVTYKYGEESSNKKQETIVDAFIYSPSDNGKRKEIHSPMQLPTSKADYSFFGQKDDRSVPEKNIYYVSNKDNIYPFAFYLANANLDDIEALKDFDKNEKTAISKLYPSFIDWAKNGTNADWYKKK